MILVGGITDDMNDDDDEVVALPRVMLQGYNKSIFISEKTFSLIL